MTASPTLRAAIIGAGIGRAYAAALDARHDVEVVAVCTRTAASADAFAAEHPAARPYTDARQMLAAESPDLVAVTAPDHLHRDLTLASLDAGAHVLCEKPLALDATQARELLEAAEAAGRVHFVPFVWRFLPAAQLVAELVAEGVLGRPWLVDVRYSTRGWGDPHGPMRWQFDGSRAAGGALWNTGSHVLHLIDWWLGPFARIVVQLSRTVPSRAWPDGERADVGVEDIATLLGTLTDGTQVALAASWVAYVGRATLEIALQGSEGAIVLVADLADLDGGIGRVSVMRRGDDRPTTVEVPARLRQEPAETPASTSALRACHARMTNELVTAIREGRAARPNFADGLRVQQVLDAAAASAEHGRWVQCDGTTDGQP